MEERYVLAREAAARIGVRTSTLRKWRTLGKGPAGWLHLGRTVVVYPVSALDSYLDELKEKKAAAEATARGGDGLAC